MSMADKCDNISNPSQMAKVVGNNLVKGIRVGGSITHKTFVISNMASAEFHVGIQRELVPMLLERFHMITKFVWSSVAIRQGIREEPVTHTDTE